MWHARHGSDSPSPAAFRFIALEELPPNMVDVPDVLAKSEEAPSKWIDVVDPAKKVAALDSYSFLPSKKGDRVRPGIPTAYRRHRCVIQRDK